MAAVRFLCVSVVSLLVGIAVARAQPLRDEPVRWYDDDRRDIPEPSERDPNLVFDYYNETVARSVGRFTRPNRLVRRVGGLWGADHVKMAANVNRLGEVPNSSWFTNRIGLFPMTVEEVARGSGAGVGPDRSGPWTVVGAKTEGVTPGFTIRDATGARYLIKFDPPGHEGMVTGAGVISQRILHAAGYFVPDDNIVYFSRGDLVVGEDVDFEDEDGNERLMTEADVDEILARVARSGERWRAISSRFLAGKPVGPFDYHGRRDDDPNDRVDHQQRREIRGLEVFAAWLNHFDTKQHNTLDMYVEQDGRRYIRHHLIDFASTLGTGAEGPVQRLGWETTIDPVAFVRRTLNLGLLEDDWRRLQRPASLEEIAFYESELFDPTGFESQYPNPGFADQTHRDAYWAAKIISAFTDEHLAAIAAQARFADPDATAYMAETLAARRDKIARVWFDRIPPLDFFVAGERGVTYHDLAAERDVYPGTTPRYRTRVHAVDADREPQTEATWVESDVTTVDIAGVTEGPFVAIECQVDRGEGWSRSVVAYVARGSGRVVAVDRKP